MEHDTTFILTVFNQAHKKMNVLYHNYAKAIGLSDSAFWLLYSLYEHEAPCTQRDLCQSWFYAPQTINTALKSLEGQGYIQLAFAPGNQKSKRILFTPAGKALVRDKIAPLVRAEERSFDRLSPEEREKLLELTRKHISLLESEIKEIEE